MSWQAIELTGADLSLDSEFLPKADADQFLCQVREQVVWENHRIMLFGRERSTPRLSCWIGDPGSIYRYSGMSFTPKPWTRAVSLLRDRLERATGLRFNSVLANLYRSGADSMGWHSDGETELGPEPIIASVSLGAVRRFSLRSRPPAAQRIALDLAHGSLLLMRGATQSNYQHALPKTARVVGERINLTFRYVCPLRPNSSATRR